MAKNIRSLITKDLIGAAIPSNQKYGAAIFERHAVEMIKRDSEIIEAWAGGLDGTMKEGGGTRRRVTFSLHQGTLKWHCTGNPKDHQIFCKHCVAVTLFVLHGS